MSGSEPSEHLSSDLESVVVAGLKWFPKGDFIKMNISEINFAKKERGRKPLHNKGCIPDKLTKRDCVNRVAEVFDPLGGRVAPILGGMKLDISDLHEHGIGWDDSIPNSMKNVWGANFDLIQEIGNIEFHRAVIPPDALNLDIETLEMAAASEKLICSAVYARFERLGRGYSCQLIFARNKIVHDITIPRAELDAAVLNVSTGHIVHGSLMSVLDILYMRH